MPKPEANLILTNWTQIKFAKSLYYDHILKRCYWWLNNYLFSWRQRCLLKVDRTFVHRVSEWIQTSVWHAGVLNTHFMAKTLLLIKRTTPDFLYDQDNSTPNLQLWSTLNDTKLPSYKQKANYNPWHGRTPKTVCQRSEFHHISN